jgi:hypothetical protein
MRRLPLLALLVVFGCTEVKQECRTGQTTTTTVSGQDFSTITQLVGTITTLVPLFASKAPAATREAAVTSTANSCGTVDVKTTTVGGPISVTTANFPTPPPVSK